ncbi:MAG TPA: prolyl oligopeptidase family serine peptidase [Burkholderiales bacterium]
MRRIAVLLACALAVPAAQAQKEVEFPTAPTARFGAEDSVEAILTLPGNASGKVPAVVLIHNAGGYDPAHYEFYAAPLRAAGIATLGLILSRAPSQRMPSVWIPHVYGAYKFLAAQPEIDAARIGVMGMSLGGLLSLYTASELFTREHLGDGPRFAAHAALYPVCWVHEAIANGSAARRNRAMAGAYDRLTGAPQLVLAGARDDDDAPDSCEKFLAALSAEARRNVTLHVFPDATHLWDQGPDRRYYDPICRGGGCQVTVRYDPAIALQGRDMVVEFFSRHLVGAR